MEEDLKVLVGYLKDFGSRRRFILKVLIFFLILGLFVGIFSDKKFVASTSFITKESSDEKAGSGIKNIAALIGLNLGENTDSKDVPIYLYPKIIQSVMYRRELLETPIYIKGQNAPVTLSYYLTDIKSPDPVTIFKKFTIGLPGLFIKQFTKKSPSPVKIDSLNYITLEEVSLFAKLEEILLFSIDENDGSILLTVVLDENVAATQLVERAKDLLQEKIIWFRLIKVQENLDYITKEYLERKEEFENIQLSLAQFNDANFYNVTEKSLVRKKKLELEYSLSSAVYTELEGQKVRQELKVREDTPIFVTLKRAFVPLEPINDNIVVVILKFLAIGFVASVFIYITRLVFSKFKNIWRSA